MTRHALWAFATILVAVAAAPGQVAPASVPVQVPPAQPLPDSGFIDVALLGADRPVHVRLHISVDGRPISKTWRRHIESWFKFLDRDGDNVLAEAELQYAPPAPAMLQGMRQGNIVYSTGLGIAADNFGDKRSANLAEFIEYYLANGAGPISAGAGFNSTDPLSEALFKRLDRDKDGKLSKAELLAAAKSLKSLDVDDDETVSSQELAGTANNFNGNLDVVFATGRQQPPAQQGPSLIILGTSTSVQGLFARYDRNKDGKLEPVEFAINPKVFAQLDTDGNGSLARDEFAAWQDLPAETEWSAAWPGSTAPDKSGTKAAGPNRLALADMDIQFVPLARTAAPKGFSPAQYLLTIYKNAAAGREFVEAADLKTPQLRVLGQMFEFLDRDKNGRLTEKEVQALVDLQAEALSCHVSLAFFDQGRGLFAMIDSDRDGRLSAREMRDAWSRLESRSHDHVVAREDIPRQCTLSAGLGFQALTFRPGNVAASAVPMYPSGVPTWFTKMDINSDGEVSRREFLGSDADFRRFDANNDGFVSADEVMRAARKE